MTLRATILVALACLLTLLLYIPALHGPFIFDDYTNLGALIKYPSDHGLKALGLYLSESRDFPGRPLSMLSFYPQRNDWPNNSFPFKFVNTLLHLLCGLALAWLSSLLLKARRTLNSSTAPLVVAFITAAWLLSPIQLSTVMLVVQRMTQLSTLFMLIGLTLYVAAITRVESSLRIRALQMSAGIAICAPIAFLCKETGALLPVYAWVLDSTLLLSEQQKLPKALRWTRRMLVVAPSAILLFSLLIATPHFAHGYALRNFDLSQRLLTESRIIFDYLGQIFLPIISDYTLYHDDIRISTDLLHPPATALSLLTIVTLVSISFLKRSEWPLLAFGVLWYLAGQLLESTSISLELYFEHRTYMPMIGPLLATTIAIAETRRPRIQKLLIFLAMAWLAASTIATATWARVWSNPDTLATAWARFHPDSPRSLSFLAQQQIAHLQLEPARKTMLRLMEKYPGDSSAAIRLVEIECEQQTLSNADLDRLATLLTSATYDRSGYLEMQQLREQAQEGTCRTALTTERWNQLTDAMLADPRYQADTIAMGFLHYQKSQAAVFKHNLVEALNQLELTNNIDPDPEIPREEATYLVSAGLYDQAIATLEAAQPNKYPLLRRLLVDDRARWDQDIATIRVIQQKHSSHP